MKIIIKFASMYFCCCLDFFKFHPSFILTIYDTFLHYRSGTKIYIYTLRNESEIVEEEEEEEEKFCDYF